MHFLFGLLVLAIICLIVLKYGNPRVVSPEVEYEKGFSDGRKYEEAFQKGKASVKPGDTPSRLG